VDGYLRHSCDFSANPPSSAVFSGSCESCFYVKTKVFGHIPYNVAVAQYNTISRFTLVPVHDIRLHNSNINKNPTTLQCGDVLLCAIYCTVYIHLQIAE
jgi:hypothetical protein